MGREKGENPPEELLLELTPYSSVYRGLLGRLVIRQSPEVPEDQRGIYTLCGKGALSVNTYNALMRCGFRFVEELQAADAAGLFRRVIESKTKPQQQRLDIPRFGRKAYQELRSVSAFFSLPS